MIRVINLIIIVVILILTSCSKNQSEKVFLNEDLGKENTLYIEHIESIDLKKDSIFNPVDIELSSTNEIFILDFKSSLIHKYDSNLKKEMSFGSKGQGPGEMIFPYHLLNLNDTLYTIGMGNQKLSTFTTNGNFIKEFFTGNIIPAQPVISHDNKIAGYTFGIDEANNIKISLNILDHSLNKVKEIYSKRMKMDMSLALSDFAPKITSNGDYFYLSERNKDDYSIDVFDHNLNYFYKVKKKFRKIKYHKNEIENELKKSKQFFGKSIKMKRNFKNSINDIFSTKRYLYVNYSSEYKENTKNYLKFDVYENGILKKKIIIKDQEINDYATPFIHFKFTDNYLFILNGIESILYKYDLFTII